MHRAVAFLMLVLLAVLHAPSSAQALRSALLPDFFSFGTSEPVTLVLTGVALLSLARIRR